MTDKLTTAQRDLLLELCSHQDRWILMEQCASRAPQARVLVRKGLAIVRRAHGAGILTACEFRASPKGREVARIIRERMER